MPNELIMMHLLGESGARYEKALIKGRNEEDVTRFVGF